MRKKILTGFMAGAMALMMPLTTYAAGGTFTEDGNATIKVSCTVKSEYTVSLPAALTLVDEGDGSFSADGTVMVKGDIAADKRVVVVPTSGEMENGSLTQESINKGNDMVDSIENGYLDTLGDSVYSTEIDFVNTKNSSKVVKGELTQEAVSFRSLYSSAGASPCEYVLFDKDVYSTSAVHLSVDIDEPASYDGFIVYTFRLADKT